MIAEIKPYLHVDAELTQRDCYLEIPIQKPTKGLRANAYYFGKHEWAEEYLTYCHRDNAFISR